MKKFVVLLLVLVISLVSGAAAANAAPGDDGKGLGADLAVVNLRAPSAVTAAQRFTVSWTVTNQGIETARNTWGDELYLSKDAVLDEGDILLATHAHENLAGGASYSPSVRVSLLGSIFPTSKVDPPMITPPYFQKVQYLILHTGCGYRDRNTANNIYVVAIKVNTVDTPH